jgi:hypothetical protein
MQLFPPQDGTATDNCSPDVGPFPLEIRATPSSGAGGVGVVILILIALGGSRHDNVEK